MEKHRCPSCGEQITTAPHCPQCGAEQPEWADELGRIDRSIADMKARDAALAKEQKQIASKMQAALFQRDILAHASEQQRQKKPSRARRVLRRRPGQRPPTAAPGAPPTAAATGAPGAAPGTSTTSPGAPPRVPRQPRTAEGSGPYVAPPPPPPPPGGERSWPPDRPDGPGTRPEASSREVQNIQLGLGALLLGVAAIVFAAVAISSFGAVSRIAILLVATVVLLAAPPLIARRGLTSTAETIAAVGLLLVPLTGYALWTVDSVRGSGFSGTVYGSLTFLVTAAVSAAYARAVVLRTPRYATVLAIQPVLPLLAYEWITGPAGWALVLTVVAAVDLLLARVGAAGRTGPVGGFDRRVGGFDAGGDVGTAGAAEDVAPGRGRARPGPVRPGPDAADPNAAAGPDAADPNAAAGPDAADPDVDGPGRPRPESAPEEADAVLLTEPRRPVPRLLPPAPWLRELIYALHGFAVVAAIGYAVIALLGADTVPSASRAALTLLLASATGLAGALTLGHPTLSNFAAGVMTLAVIGAAGRVAAVALPGRALLLIAVVIALTGVGVRALPEYARRGPQLASAAALVVIGIVVAGSALRAALAPIRAALPPWAADLGDYGTQLAAAVGPAGWQLAATAFLLTVAAVLSLPPEVRRESAVAGAALTALALPASVGLGWSAAPWPAVLAAGGIGLVGLTAITRRAALSHAVGAGVVGLAAAGMSLARPGLTAAVLTALVAFGLLTAYAPAPDTLPGGPLGGAALRLGRAGTAADIEEPGATRRLREWAAGGAAFALPGAVAAFVAALVTIPANPTAAQLRDATEPILAASFLAVCATIGYAALTQVAQRQIGPPLALGTGLGALVVTAAAFGAPGATWIDVGVGALLLVAAVLLVLAPSIDAGRRADRLFDGSDIAAAAATLALTGTLARIATILIPRATLAAAALLILLVAVGVRAMPEDWRRGPLLGLSVAGGAAAAIAGYLALAGGLRVLAMPGPIWASDLDAWSATADSGAWQVPIALVLIAIAAAVALPPPWGYDVAGVCAVLATIGTPAALGLAWWSPIAVGGAVATGFGVAAVAAADPRASRTRAVVAAAVALHAVGASLVRPWTTAAALGLIVLVGVLVAVLARGMTRLDDPDGMLPHLAQVGGAATAGALLALPGAVAALAAALGWPAQVVLSAALGASSLGVALLAAAGRHVPQYLPYGTVGIVGGATVTAIAALPTGLPWGVYAAAAALLGVLAELIRATTPLPDQQETVRPLPGQQETVRPLPGQRLTTRRWAVSPALGAMIAAALPSALAVAAVAPALAAALIEPYGTLRRIWQGPPAGLAEPPAGAVDGTNVLAALLLTLAAGLAATGFAGGRPARAVPVVLPGAAITLLIAPISLDAGWPATTMAALAVFTLAMLGLALTAPPAISERARSLRVGRMLVFGIGLAAGGAGLAGSLATRGMTLFTLGGAVGVGAVAALVGRSQRARILGWLFASVMAQLFILTAALVFGLDRAWAAFGVLAVGAVLLFGAATIPRLSRPEAVREAATVEWSGHAAALIALALAYDSPRHIAALLAAWGAVLGVAATRTGRSTVERRILFWAAVGCEIVAWWVLMRVADVALPEAYTLPFAALALLVGVLELRHRPDLSSWVAYGPALVAALLPSLVIVLATGGGNLRQVLLLLGAVATLIFGSIRQQQAPVIIGTVVTVIATLHLLTAFGPWLVLIPVGLVLLLLGASNENRRRTQDRFRVVRGMQ